MSRSGNHAIIHWLLNQVSGRYCFLNCAEPRSNPFATARPMDSLGKVVETNYQDFDLLAERAGYLSRKNLLYYSHEDCFLGTLSRGEAFDRYHDEWVGTSRRRVDLLVLRDPFNLFASRIHGNVHNSANQVALRIWKQHAREFLGERQNLRQDRVLVNFNRWVIDEDYRRQLAEALGFEFSDAGRQHVPRVARGSSFDGRRYHGNAAAMPVLDRWKWFQQNPEHAPAIDQEAMALSRSIFGSTGCQLSLADRSSSIQTVSQ